MAEFFLMPQSSPTMEIGKLVTWRVNEGDSVQPQDIIAEVETDKAVAEIEVFDPCVILKLLYPVGSEIPVDTPIAIVGAKADEDIASLLKALENKTADQNTKEEPGAKAKDVRVKAGPAARKSADELGVELGAVQGTGPGGRVMRKDVEKAVTSDNSRPADSEDAGIVPFTWKNKPIHKAIMEPILSFKPKQAHPKRRGRMGSSALPPIQLEVIPNSMMRKTIAKRLKSSYLDAPVFFLNAKLNCENMVALRSQLKSAGIRVSYNDIVLKAVARALRDVPAVNASWSEDSITRHGDVNVGVAVALPDGLITPVIRNADTKALPDISIETRKLAQRARDMKLQPEEYQGSTFTVSNLGMMGIEHFTAIINPPNAAILAVGAMQKEPVVIDDELLVGWRMKVTMTCDHRVIDGALGATFLQAFRKYLENPVLLII